MQCDNDFPQGENFPQWAEDMTAAAAHPNVYCKLSGLINEVGEEQEDGDYQEDLEDQEDQENL